MFNYSLDYDEGILLESENVLWASRGDLDINNFALSNKKIYCAYEKSNGLFKKPTKEVCVLLLYDIKIINGKALVEQVKYDGAWCLQIQFKQGIEYFAFTDSPKKRIPQWIAAINNALRISADTTTATKRLSPFAGMFSGSLSEVADSFKNVIDTATESFGISSKGTDNVTTASAENCATAEKIFRASEEKKTNGYVFCAQCGTKLSQGTKFCPNCGYKIEVIEKPSGDTYTQKVEVQKGSIPPVTSSQEENNSNIAKSQRQQEYIGKIYKCPQCGGIVNQADVICGSCGFHLSGKKAVISAMDFQQQLLKIEMMRKDKKFGFWDQHEALDATDKRIISLIKSYPIPNTIEDIVEFFYLAIGNIDVSKSKKSVFNSDTWDGGSRERAISNAWVGKLQQIYKKAELLFPNEPEFVHVKEAYLSMMRELKMPV